MISKEELLQIREVCRDIEVQVMNPSHPPIILQIFVPSEDLEILKKHSRMIIIDFCRHGIDSQFTHAAVYLMVYVAFEYYDSSYWKHLSEFISYNLSSNETQALGMNLLEYVERNDFHTRAEGNRYVGTLLFNAGVPKNYATKFFEKARSMYDQVHGVLSDDNLRYLKTEIEDAFSEGYSSSGGQAKGVREFLADLDYSSVLWKDILTRIDSPDSNPQNGMTYDLGVLEKPFNEWISGAGISKNSKAKNLETGLYLNTHNLVPYVHISEEEVEGLSPILSFGEGQELVVGVKRVGDRVVTTPYNHPLRGEGTLSGFTVTLEGREIVNTSPSEFIIFNGTGRMSGTLSRGTNYVLCDSEDEVAGHTTMTYLGDYAIFVLEGLETGDTVEICGKSIPVGFSQTHHVHWIYQELPAEVKYNSEKIHCLGSHPKVNIDSEFSECLIYVYGSNSELLKKSYIHHDEFSMYDVGNLIPETGGYYRIIIRFGAMRFSTSYALVPDLDIESERPISTTSGVMSVRVWDDTYKIVVGSDDFYKDVEVIKFGSQFDFRIRTNVLGFKLARATSFRTTGQSISREELTDTLWISTGQMNDGVVELDVYSGNRKLTGTRYQTVVGGEAHFNLSILAYSIRFEFGKLSFMITLNGERFDLFTVAESYGIDVDSDIKGICLITARSVPFGRKAVCIGAYDSTDFEFDLKSGDVRDIIYENNLKCQIHDSATGHVIQSIELEQSKDECRLASKTLDEYKITSDFQGALYEAKWKISKCQYSSALPYLELCILNQYPPAYEYYAFCMLLHLKDTKKYKTYIHKAAESGSKLSVLLDELINKFRYFL